jgi:uncharacterized protein YgbK (DUF1537 family)
MPQLPALLGLIADDLTGACDAGVQFAQRGLSTVVWLAPEPPPEAPALLALVTGGRSLAPAAAREAAAAACRRLAAEGRAIVFQKIDSTFRGNPGAEILAVMETAGFPYAVITPAFPAMGRTVERGCLRVAGVAGCLHLAPRLTEQGAQRVLEIGTDQFEELPRLSAGESTLIVADARSPEDLARLARIWFSLDPRPLLAGSAGLAAEIASLLGAPASGLAASTGEPGPVLLISGSTHPATKAQIKLLVQTGAALVSSGELDSARQALAAGRHTVALMDATHASIEDAALLAGLVRECPVRALILSGGDTAMLVLRALSAKGVRLEREIQTGIPWGRLVGGVLDRLPVTTKAGGFGDDAALIRSVSYLSRLPALQ